MDGTMETPTEGTAPTESAPPFPTRVGWALFSPGRLADALARTPVWGLAMVVGAALIFTQTLLIPPDVWDTFIRGQALQSGRELPENFSMAAGVARGFALGLGTLFFAVIQFVFAGIVTFLFAFVFGDEGRYKQYLAVTTHAWLIPALVGLCLVPLRISQENPQFTLNVASFFFFLPRGYLNSVLSLLDLSQLWAWLVIAQGAAAIDRRRSFGSAVTTLMVLNVVIAMLFALTPNAPGK